jgi:hypothetical protein
MCSSEFTRKFKSGFKQEFTQEILGSKDPALGPLFHNSAMNGCNIMSLSLALLRQL